MKYPKNQYDILLKAFVCVIVRKGYTVDQVREDYKYRCHPMKLGWDLFRMAAAHDDDGESDDDDIFDTMVFWAERIAPQDSDDDDSESS